jgi:hypothetical protein
MIAGRRRIIKPQRYYDLNYREKVVLWPDGVRGPVAGWFFERGNPGRPGGTSAQRLV